MAVAPAAALAAEDMVERREKYWIVPHTHTTITTTLALVIAQPPHSPQQPFASPGPGPGVEKHAHLPQPGRWK